MTEIFIVVAIKNLPTQSKQKVLRTFDDDKSVLSFVHESSAVNDDIIRIFSVDEFGKVTPYDIVVSGYKLKLEPIPEQG